MLESSIMLILIQKLNQVHRDLCCIKIGAKDAIIYQWFHQKRA